MTKKSNAHTLVELIIIVVMLAVVAFIAIPRLQFSTLYRKQADTVARKIVTDLRRARELAISNAATVPNGYALSRTGLTCQIVDGNETPIPNSIFSIDPKITCSDGTYFRFGPLGNLDLNKSDSNKLTISAQGKIFTISITSATGMIKCTQN
jgi:type II secretory pathway pseudopilin PulG